MHNVGLRLEDLDPESRERIKARARALAAASRVILDVLGPKLPPERLESERQTQFAGEWAVMFDSVCATLLKRRIPLSLAERDLVAETLALFGPGCGPGYDFLDDPEGVLAGLTVIDDDGRQLSPPPDFDAENWWPRGYPARFRWGRVGGHLHGTGIPHKTTFPSSWDAEKINAQVLDVARNPDEVPHRDRNGGWITRGTRENIRIEVRLRPDGPITIAYPISGLGVHRNDADGNPSDQQW